MEQIINYIKANYDNNILYTHTNIENIDTENKLLSTKIINFINDIITNKIKLDNDGDEKKIWIIVNTDENKLEELANVINNFYQPSNIYKNQNISKFVDSSIKKNYKNMQIKNLFHNEFKKTLWCDIKITSILNNFDDEKSTDDIDVELANLFDNILSNTIQYNNLIIFYMTTEEKENYYLLDDIKNLVMQYICKEYKYNCKIQQMLL